MPSLAHGRSRTPARSGWALTVVASLGLHLGLALWIWQLPAPDALLPPELVWLDADVASAPLEDGPSGAVRRDADEARPGGARSAQNVDARSRGERGDGRGAMEVVLLTDRAHGVTLQDGPMNAPHVSQIQRIRTARDRASWENRRATPNPNDQPFLASGEGRHPERRPVSARDAAEGARRAPAPGRAGDPTDGPAGARGPDPLLPERGRAGSAEPSPGRGILRGRGARRSEAARVAFGRPPVDEGPAATLAPEASRVRDDTDAERLAGQLVQSVVDASERGGPERGEGVGGVGGGGAPGSGGGRGEGGRAAPHGPGGGDFAALDTSSARYRRWYLRQRRRVEERLIFPRERALAMDQGTSVYRLVVARDGRLRRPPRRIRSTGFDDMDRAARAAIEAAAPFDPLPADLVPDQEALRLDMTVEFANPMVD